MNKIKEFLMFKKLGTPFIVQIIFWVGIAGWVVRLIGLVSELSTGAINIIGAMGIIIFWPIMLRIYCELIMMVFNMQKSLKEINEKISK